MSCSSLTKGVKIKIEGESYVLRKRVENHSWQCEEINTGNLIRLSIAELEKLYLNRKLVFNEGFITEKDPRQKIPNLTSELSDEDWQTLKIKRAYVNAVIDSPNSLKAFEPLIRKVWVMISQNTLPKPPNWSTVYRWKKRYMKSGQDIMSLADNHSKKGNTGSRYPKEVEAIVNRAIDEIYLTPEKGNLKKVFERATLLVLKENSLLVQSMQLPLPSPRLIKRLISAIPAFDVCMARDGRNIALNKFRTVTSHRITQAPLERAEIDHTQLDLMLVDENGFPLGRPWITACIDDYSRCILGISVSFEPPSFLTVAQCLKMAILPKANLREEYPEIKSAWDAHGVMRELVVDNGMEFHGENLEKACYSLGIEIHYSARKTPWFKGKIERFLGTINKELAHGNPGTTFSNIFDKGEYDPVKHAVIKYSTFQKIYRTWIADVYHQELHRSLKASPASIWKSSINSGDILLPDNVAQLDAILSRSETRVLTHKGIELDGLLYNSQELAALRRRFGTKLQVQIQIDDSDLGQIIVLSPSNNELITVPALLNHYAKGLSKYQHRICKRLSQKHLDKDDVFGCLQAKQMIQDWIDQDLKTGPKKIRQKVNRFRGDKSLISKSVSPIDELPAPQLGHSTSLKSNAVDDIGPDAPRNVQASQRKIRTFEPIISNRTLNWGTE
ncbi:Mu transposase C-terminal domain-containing protein [Polynucleobacter sp. AP-Ainpum-60-G11]|uniref:Mu transposase C-terminal domain-containing protein n=1 Tax=Polynucleobacter sp. AP-Ainpum-60-G11 TaxID=2576926 RepID=UPI001BFE3BAC|nr:Mu transposase C-terminal domain-containing protein [Polynucleobacter sp. AP-Ainpum-60-G11]QWE27067.1 DDE-type integrase/transposase/recombinase [Polynucleobacter sp. AP-Ainpum-60-G11]